MTTYELHVIKGAEHDKVFRLEADEIVIGRDRSCQISLDDRTVSRRHAKIIRSGENLTIEDLGGANGTLVNGVCINSQHLKEDDRVTLGGIELRLRRVADKSSTPGQPFPAVTPDQMPASQLVSSTLALDELLNEILDEIFATFQPERAFILLIDPQSDQLAVKASRWQDEKGLPHRISISQSVIDHVFKKKESVLIDDAMYDPKFSLAKSIVLHEIRSAMCSPLRGRDRIIGIIHVDRSTRGSEFSREDLLHLDAIAKTSGIAIENSELDQEKI